MGNAKKYVGILGLTLLLSACGGGGGDGGGAASANSSGNPSAGGQAGAGLQAAPDAQIVAYLTSSNIDFVPGANRRPAGTWRWADTPARHIRVYLPAPAAGNATQSDYATKVRTSVALINARLAGLVALDLADSQPAGGNYIHVSYLTSYVPPGSTDYASYCANVSTEPNSGSMVMPDAQNGIYSSPVYVNLGNGHCDVTQDIVTHEFGHALGLANHFAGFGDAPVHASADWDVLATLYGNPQSTLPANLVVRRAAR